MRSVLLLALAAGLAMPVSATVVVDNSPPIAGAGNQLSLFIVAEDFVLGAPATITDVTFWAYELTPSQYSGSVFWQIYGDLAGAPDNATVFGSGVVAVAPANLGPGAGAGGGNDSLRFDFSIGAVALGPGAYWIGFHNGPLTNTTGGFLWQLAAPNATAFGRDDATPFGTGPWGFTGAEHAFQLHNNSGVPEPATIVLVAAGLGAFGLVRRRR